jgi:hypothetical protein
MKQPVAVDAAHVVAEAVRGLTEAVRKLEPAQPPRNVSPARRARAAWLLLIPGAAREFEKRVPADHLEDEENDPGGAVRCVCEARTVLKRGELAECAGGCGRWFLRTDGSVRVAKWEAPCELEDRYAGAGWTPAEAA